MFSRANEIRGVDLTSAYYHTIPTINVPHAITPATIDFDASNKRIYWTDVQMNEVKTSNLIGGPAETIIDSGKEELVFWQNLNFSVEFFGVWCTMLIASIFSV